MRCPGTRALHAAFLRGPNRAEIGRSHLLAVLRRGRARISARPFQPHGHFEAPSREPAENYLVSLKVEQFRASNYHAWRGRGTAENFQRNGRRVLLRRRGIIRIGEQDLFVKLMHLSEYVNAGGSNVVRH